MADIERRETLPLLDILIPKALVIFDLERRYASFGHRYTGPADLMQASHSAVQEVAKERLSMQKQFLQSLGQEVTLNRSC